MKKKMIIGVCLLTVLIGALLIVQRIISKDTTVKEPATTGKVTESQTNELQEEEDTRLRLCFSCADMSNPYYAALEASLRYEVNENDAVLETRDACRDQDLQNSQLEEFASSGADAVLLIPVTTDGADEAIKKLTDMKIPVIGLDSRNSDPDLLSCFVGSDQNTAGKLCGKDLVKRAPEGGNILILEAASIGSISDCISGFEHEIAGDGFVVADRSDCAGSRENAKQYMIDRIAKQEELAAIMCGSDNMALGVLEALEQYNTKHPENTVHPLIYSVGGYPELKEKLAADDPALTATVATSPLQVGQDAAVAAFNSIEENKKEEEILEKPYLINRYNIKLYGIDGWQ